MTMRDRFTTTVARLLDEDRRVALVLADIGADRFATTGVTRRHPLRVVNVGIREQLMIGVAAGWSLAGFRPIAHTYAPFLVERAFEQIKLDLVHQDLGSVLVSIGASYDASAEGRTHQAPGDVALLATLPGVTVMVPGHPDEAETAVVEAARAQGVSYIRLAADTNPRAVPGSDAGIVTVRAGSSTAPTVLVVGPLLGPVLAATADLDVSVAYTTVARPFDRAWLRRQAPAHVVLVEPYLAGTSSGEIAAALADRPHRVTALGVDGGEIRRYGRRSEHAAVHGLDVTGLRASVVAAVA